MTTNSTRRLSPQSVIHSLETLDDIIRVRRNSEDLKASSGFNNNHSDIPKMNFAGGLLRLGEFTDDGLNQIVNPFLRKGSIFAFVLWILLLIAIYSFAPADSFERLEGAELNANIIVLVLLLYTNISRIMMLVIRDQNLISVNSGIMFGSSVAQLIAVFSIALMIFFPTPVMVDPVTGIRSHLVRWAEWVALAFLMTFLTESIDMPLQGTGGHTIGWVHGIAIGLSSSAGAVLAFCTNWTVWLTVFGCAWTLFCSIYVRLFQRYTRLSKMPPAITVDEKEEYDRAKYSLKTILVCAVTWSGLALSWSVIALSAPYAAPDSIFSNDSLVLVTESVFEIISKVWYSNLLLEIHNIVFDDANRTIRRLEELRSFISAVWDTSSDVIIWCSRTGNRINGIVSPSFFNIDETSKDLNGQGEDHSDMHTMTMIIEVDIESESYKTFLVNLSLPITRREAMTMMCSVSKVKGKMPENSSVHDKNIAVVAELLREAYRSKSKEKTIIKTLYGTTPTKAEYELRCEAKMTESKRQCEATLRTLESASFLIIIRDISERFQRFEMEKKLIAEITARTKDSEANRFTRHEVKNGILAAISLLESIRCTPQLSSGTRGGLDKPANECSDNSLVGFDFSNHDDNLEELDNTLKDILDTIMEHAMSKEVVNEEYGIRKELVMVPEVLSNIRRLAGSNGSRFSFLMKPTEFPTLGMDPRLLRYIYQNALSNACRYGLSDGDIKTSIFHDESKKEFRMEVVNMPGFAHEELMKMNQEEVNNLVFAPGTSLHNRSMEKQELPLANSSGDGAWIMRKCARILKGDCVIRFEKDRTVFSFWCPARNYTKLNDLESSGFFELSLLPDTTWGIVIDDSGIQRKLMDRFLKIAGIQKERRVIVGQNSTEIYGFADFVVDLVKSNPNDKLLVIADENLEVGDGAALHGMVSGSLCLQKIMGKLEPSESARVLTLVRSANDSTKDIEMYKSRAHGYLLKEPIDKLGVLNTILPWWFKRFPPTRGRTSRPGTSLSDSCSSIGSAESEGHDPFHDIITVLEIVDALCYASGTDSLRKRWRPIQDRLQVLKGDLKTIVPGRSEGDEAGADLDCVIEVIDNLRLGEFPGDLKERWATLKSQINAVMDAHK